MDAHGAQPLALQRHRMRTDRHAGATDVGGDAVAQVHLGERAAGAVRRRFDSSRGELCGACLLPEHPQRVARVLPRVRIDVREECSLAVLGLLGRESCPTGYHAGRRV